MTNRTLRIVGTDGDVTRDVAFMDDIAEIEEFDVESVEFAPESNMRDQKSGQEVASISEDEEYLIKLAIRFAIEDRDSTRIIQDPYEDT